MKHFAAEINVYINSEDLAENSYRRNLSGTSKNSKMGCMAERPKATSALQSGLGNLSCSHTPLPVTIAISCLTQYCIKRVLGFTRYVAIHILCHLPAGP